MSTPNSSEASKVKSNNNKVTIIIALMAVIIIIQAVKWYLDAQDIKELSEQKQSTEEQLAETMQDLEDIRGQLEIKIKEIEQLGGDVTELQKAKEDIEQELKKKNRVNGKLIKALQDKVDGYQELLVVKDKEIERLKAHNEKLFEENTTLKTEKNELGDSIHRLSQSKTELESKVAIASHLKAEKFSITALTDRGKEKESPFKARQLKQLKVEFSIAKNEVAPIEGKNIMIRIVDQNGQVIFDVAHGSGTFMFNNKEEFYTAAQEILFDNSGQRLSFLYDKGTEYEKGIYTLEVYTDDYLMGGDQFEVK